MKMEKLNGELRKFICLGRKILTLQIDPLPCEHPLKSSVPFRSGPFRSVPFSCERGLERNIITLHKALVTNGAWFARTDHFMKSESLVSIVVKYFCHGWSKQDQCI